MINKTTLITFFILGFAITTNAELIKLEEYKTKIEKTLPYGWEISKISEKAVPYNLTLIENEKPGISFELTGPEIEIKSSEKNPLKISKTPKKESLAIWIMSFDYSMTESETQGQFYKATLLGANEEISVYIKTFFSDTPTWKSWREDLFSIFELKIPYLDRTYEHGPAEKETSKAAHLAENFMKTQPDAAKYSPKATGVFQDEIGTYIVRFELLDGSSKNAALVQVVMAGKSCKRIKVK